MKKPAQCNQCVLPDSRSIPLDNSGVCRICRSESVSERAMSKFDPAKLQAIIDETKARGESREYDCMVAWSGGRDSTFLIHELVTRHSLRCVAIFGKTPFTPQEIIDNVHRIAKSLNVKLVEIESPRSHLDIARFCVEEWMTNPDPILINLACAPCKFINSRIFREAHRLGVRTVIYGGNPYEYLHAGPASIDLDTDSRYSLPSMIRDGVHRIGKGTKTLIRNPILLKHLITLARASLLYVNQYTPYLRLRYPGVLRFDYFHFEEWDEKRMMDALSTVGWQLPPGCTSTWRADCLFEAVRNSAFERQLGFTYNHAMYSNLVRAGKMTRDEALQRLERENVSESRLDSALGLLKISRERFSMNVDR